MRSQELRKVCFPAPGSPMTTWMYRKSSRFPVWSMTPRPGHRCAITRRCNDERRDPACYLRLGMRFA